MYFAINSGRTLTVGENPSTAEYEILGICVNNRKDHFCVLTESEIAVWKVRVRETRYTVN